MANDLFGLGNLGGLMRGLSGLMPQDDPGVKQMNLQSRLGDLQSEEEALYAAVGKAVLAEEPERFPEEMQALARLRQQRDSAQAELAAAREAQKTAEQEQQRREAEHTCAQCGALNPDGVRFCQECGARLGPAVCAVCGAALVPGTRFCGACGAKQGN